MPRNWHKTSSRKEVRLLLRTMLLIASMYAVAGWAAPATAADAPAQKTSPPPRRSVHVITLNKLQFGPMPTDVRVGDIIKWVNKDFLEHTATARDGSFDVDLKPGASVSTTLKKTGQIAFTASFTLE